MTQGAGDDPTEPRRPSRWWLIGPALVTVVALVAALWFWQWAPESAEQTEKPRRQAAIAAASKFAVTVNSYDVTDLGGYRDRVDPLLTDDYQKVFADSTKDLLAAFKKTGLKSDGKVSQAGVESIDGDSAEVLTAIDVTTLPEGLVQSVPRFRWRVSLVEQDGAWLVDGFTSIDAPDAGTSDDATPKGDS